MCGAARKAKKNSPEIVFSTEIYITKMCTTYFFFPFFTRVSFSEISSCFCYFFFLLFVEGISNICWRKTQDVVLVDTVYKYT